MEIIFSPIKLDELKELIRDAVHETIKEINNQQEVNKEDQLIRVKEACQLFGVSSVTIHTWKKNGLIPFYRISNKIYFKKEELINSVKKIRQ